MSKKLRILMCCHLPLQATLGGAKVYIEAKQTYELLGHEVKLVGIDEIVGSNQPIMDESWRVENFPKILKNYLIEHSKHYDVVEFESIYLPYDLKNEIQSIKVARSVLLDLHLKKIKIPRFKGLKSFLGLMLKKHKRDQFLNKKIEMSFQTMTYANFVNVPNLDDKNILIEFGIAPEKIIVQPYGIFENRLKQFLPYKAKTNIENHTIAFVGTFDNRKGAVEFPQLIRSILENNPNVKFKLLGVWGMFQNDERILEYLGNQYKDRILIYGKFPPEKLPELLSDCSIGVFPSYLESFGFGVLEMMALDIPVVGYNSPGINKILLPELMVERGNVGVLVQKMSQLINDNRFYQECQKKCPAKVSEFIYEKQFNASIDHYLKLSNGI